MGMEPELPRTSRWCRAFVVGSALIGLALLTDQAYQNSATYDEVTYLRVAAQWWRTGEQDSITRMGSPLTFWKLQQAPALWLVDRLGHRDWIDDPIAHQAELLPIARMSGFWTWLVTLGIAAEWARRLYGPRAMAMTSAVFALEPDLLAHGGLSTMEMPVVAAISGMLFGFWCFLRSGRARSFWASAALGGLAMSCKYTTVLIPPILGFVWAIDLWLRRGQATEDTPAERTVLALLKIARTLFVGMIGFGLVMAASNLVVTGFATIPLSAHEGPHPYLEGRFPPNIERWMDRVMATAFPNDWVGFATQSIFQRNGGPSYLFGERRTTGWLSYYPWCLAVKVPLAFWLIAVTRVASRNRTSSRSLDRSWTLPMIVGLFLLAAMMGSKRNYGIRYILPVAVPAIVWVSSVAEVGRRSRLLAWIGVGGMALAIARIHPHELSYFNEAAGGPIGGRRILSDSNLDWGQGAKSLARLQRDRPELRDLTLYYFGDTDPAYYGVEGERIVFNANRIPSGMPETLTVRTKFLAVSASLQWGPWIPPEYFRKIDGIPPLCYTDDTTIAIFRASDLRPEVEAATAGGLK